MNPVRRAQGNGPGAVPPRDSPSEGLSWPVKASFRRYVQAAPDGAIEPGDGAIMDADGFVFPWASGAVRQGPILRFTGEVRFRAYGGLLMVALRHPQLEPAGEDGRARLTIEYPWLAPEPQPRVAIADVQLSWTGVPDSIATSTTVRLTDVGSELFGDVYAVGTDFDPMTVR